MFLSLRFSQKEGIFMKHPKIIAVLMICVMVIAGNLPAEAYIFSQTRKESPQDFNKFLDDCTISERIQMLQALKDLPGLKDKYFGKLKGLPPLETFTDKKRKPSSFNEVLPETVIDAMYQEIIDPEDLSASAVRKALVWRAYNKTTYYFRGDSEIDYHGVVQWTAKKSGVISEQVKSLPTFLLENKIAEKYFEAIWDKLTHEQRIEILKHIEKEAGINLNVASIATMGGAAALATLQGVIIAYGFPVIAGTIGSWVVSLIFGSGWFVTHILAPLGYGAGWLSGAAATGIGTLITGPIGWAVTATIFAGSVFMMGSAEKETVSAFVMTVGLIKAQKYTK